MNPVIFDDISNSLLLLDYSKLKNRVVLITGATGMLASYMVYSMLILNEYFNYNIKMILVIRNMKKLVMRFGEKITRDKNVKIKLIDLTDSYDIVEPVDIIIHAASIASSHLYTMTPVETILPNCLTTHKLLEKARNDKATYFLYFSSGAVYGYVKDKDSITENDFGYLNPLDIRSCYAESKRMGEGLCAAYYKQYGINTKIVRIQHTYGPTLDLDDSRVFCEFTKNIINNQNLELKSDGQGKRSFTYISDALDAFWRVLFLGESGQAYNVCNNGSFCSISKLASILINLFPEKRLKVIRVARAESDSYAENKNANTSMLDNRKIFAIGWKPKVSIEEGFKRTVDSFMCP